METNEPIFIMKQCPKCKTISLPADDTCLNCRTNFVYVTERSNLMLGILAFLVWTLFTVTSVQIWKYLYPS